MPSFKSGTQIMTWSIRVSTVAPPAVYATPSPSSAAHGRTIMADYILVEKTQGVAIVTLNRPEQLNAMNSQLNSELHDAVQRKSADADVIYTLSLRDAHRLNQLI